MLLYGTPITWISDPPAAAPAASLSIAAAVAEPVRQCNACQVASTLISLTVCTLLERQRVYYQAGSAIAAGSQVFNNYGAKGNEELLMGYGVDPVSVLDR